MSSCQGRRQWLRVVKELMGRRRCARMKALQRRCFATTGGPKKTHKSSWNEFGGERSQQSNGFGGKGGSRGDGQIVADNAISFEEREKWDQINRQVSDWNVNIVDKKDPLPDAEDWDGYPNKYEEFGIIPIKDITNG